MEESDVYHGVVLQTKNKAEGESLIQVSFTNSSLEKKSQALFMSLSEKCSGLRPNRIVLGLKKRKNGQTTPNFGFLEWIENEFFIKVHSSLLPLNNHEVISSLPVKLDTYFLKKVSKL